MPEMYLCKSSGAKIYCREAGSGPPVILLHPVGLNSEFWHEQVEALSNNYTVISVDFPGFGHSDKPDGPFELKDFANDVAWLCQSLNLGPVVLCGQSMGGMVAQIVAVEWPHLVSGLILANTTPYGFPEVMEKRASIVEAGGMSAEVDETIKRWFTRETIQTNQPLVERIRKRLLANDPQVHGWTWRAIGKFNVLDRIQTIRVPCLVIAGERDPSTPPDVSRKIVQNISGSQYFEIPGASHMAFLEKPDVFATAVANFLAQKTS